MRSGNREPRPATSEQCLLLLYDLVVVGFGAQYAVPYRTRSRKNGLREGARGTQRDHTSAGIHHAGFIRTLFPLQTQNVVSDITSLQRVVN